MQGWGRGSERGETRRLYHTVFDAGFVATEKFGGKGIMHRNDHGKSVGSVSRYIVNRYHHSMHSQPAGPACSRDKLTRSFIKENSYLSM